MKYFTKYLPVEGDIRAGKNIPVSRDGKLTFLNLETSEKMLAFSEFEGYKNNLYKPAKLFLCSRDIQVGDKVFCPAMQRANEKVPDAAINPYFTVNTEEERQSAFNTKNIKLIGEISPDALSYVKEGDEFDVDEVGFSFPDNGMYRFSSTIKDEKNLSNAIALVNSNIWRITIKGPCGHFH